jgi:hypothetical protein
MICHKIFIRIAVLLFILIPFQVRSQSLDKVHISVQTGLSADSMTLSDNTSFLLKRKKPVLSFLLDEKIFTTADVPALKSGNNYTLEFNNKVRLVLVNGDSAGPGWQCVLEFENISGDTVSISNVIPFDSDNESVNITGKGPWDLARAWLFRPGYQPLRVILPDNAWEMGYTSFEAGNGFSVCAIARRQQTQGGQNRGIRLFFHPMQRFITTFMQISSGENGKTGCDLCSGTDICMILKSSTIHCMNGPT